MDNVKAFNSLDTIKDEAATWVVRIHRYTYQRGAYKTGAGQTGTGETGAKLPAEQRQALRAWMSQSPAHRDIFLKTLNSWDAMGMLEELAEILPLADIETGKQQTRSPRPAASWRGRLAAPFRSWRFPASIAAGVSLACALVLAVVMLAPHQVNYATGIGEQASYTLGDGSTVTLNTNSEVTIEFNDDHRQVILRRGEASFNVARDNTRPFMVYAGQGAVWAVGTVFNVNYSDSIVDVVVSHGRVKVFSGLDKQESAQALHLNESAPDNTRAVLVDAGEGAKYKDIIVSKEPLTDTAMKKKLAWQKGALIFEGETLAEAVVQIARYTEQQLIIADASISGARVGGRFKTDDIDQLLDSLALSLDIKLEKGEGNRVFFRAKQERNKNVKRL